MESLNLTPAESLIITSPTSNGIEMIKLTLLDLIIKKALKINNSTDHHVFIRKNNSFKLELKPHEEILMEIVDDHEIELQELVNIIIGKIKPSTYRNEYVLPQLVDKGYFKLQRKMLLALIPYNNYFLTVDGEYLRDLLINLLDESKNLKKWMREDLGRSKAYLSVLGPHIILLNKYDMEDIKKYNKLLSFIKPDASVSDYYSYYLYDLPDEYLEDGDLRSFDFMELDSVDFVYFHNIFSRFEGEREKKSK